MQSAQTMASVPRALPLGPFLTRRDSSYSMVPADEHELSSMPVPTPSRTTGQSASAQPDTIPLLDRLGSQDNVQKLPPSKQKSKHKYLQGWHMGVALCAFTAGTVLVINVIVTIWGAARFGVHGTLITFQDGDCSKTKETSLWLHLAINILSTLLLGASNYCMQCLSSPSRAEIDSAHSQHIWLDIGVPSVRNLRRVSWNKIILWWLLAISTIPLHVLYNSAIFSTTDANLFEFYIGSENLMTGVGLNWSLPLNDVLNPNRTLRYFQQAANWDNVTNEECIKLYSQAFVTSYNNVLAVTSALNDSSTMLNSSYPLWQEFPGNYSNGLGWVCNSPQHCDSNALMAEAANWTITINNDLYSRAIPIQYCLSQPVEGGCTLHFSLLIITIVIVCNLTKVACMMMLLLRQQAKPLVTLGDAVESFLSTPDPTTENMCMADKRKFSTKKPWLATRDPYEPKQLRWFASASWKRRLTCNILCVAALIAAGIFLSQEINISHLPSRSITYLGDLSFGNLSSGSFVNLGLGPGVTGLYLSILIENSPQVLLTFLFLTYNGLFTCMLLGHEWSGYAHVRKPLRVTSPAGSQRSTYRLQLPYKYGIPLLVSSATLHWLVSQSIFLARVSYYLDGILVPNSYGMFLGYSSIAIITVITLGGIVVLVGILHGFRRYKPGVPLVGGCSAAISAACHRPNEDVDAPFKPVMWGAVESSNFIGHCCFTSFEVTKPVKGQVYA